MIDYGIETVSVLQLASSSILTHNKELLDRSTKNKIIEIRKWLGEMRKSLAEHKFTSKIDIYNDIIAALKKEEADYNEQKS